jgi:hypothetical protein
MLCFYKICAYVSSIVDIIFRLIHILLYLPCYDGGARGLGKDSLTTSSIVGTTSINVNNERKTRKTKIAAFRNEDHDDQYRRSVVYDYDEY